MAYDEFLADRLRKVFNDKNVITEEKKMMGGLGFMVDDKLCIGIYKDALMARTDPDLTEVLLKRKNAKQMIHGGRPMKGYLTIEADGFDMEDDLEFWFQQCLDFNPKAKSSKNKK